MKSLKEFRSQINEVLKASDPIEKWIDDFVHSKNPKFAGKSTKERIEMAKGAYYGAQKNESAAISQNTKVNPVMHEDHLVHVSDGSGYDDTPHPKDIEHIKTGAMHTGGQWHGHSDKGAFFKFKSKEDAEQFKRHVDKCPHKSCYADHVNETVEYKGIGTDVVDKKKKLNPQPNLMSDKKQVKDFKEEAEELDEGDSGLAAKAKKSGVSLSTLKTVYKRGVAAWNSGHRPGTTPQQWGMARVNSYITKGKGTYGGADKDLREDARLDKKEYHKGMSDSTAKARVAHWKKADKMSDSNPKAYEPAPGDKTAKTTPSVHTKKYHAMYGEGYEHGPIDRDAKVGVGHKAAVLAGSGLDSGKHGTVVGSSKERTGDMWHIKTASGDIVKMHKHRVAKLKEETVEEAKVYDPITKKMVATKPIKVQAGGGATRNGVPVETGPSKYKERPSRPGDIYGKSFTEEVEQIDEVSKSTLMRYIPKASRDVGSHTYAGKEAGEWASHYTRAGDWENAEKHSKKSYADFKKANKRIAGIDMATKKLGTQKEEVEHVDEAIAKKLPVQHAVNAVHKTLGSKAATRFLGHLKPGTEKHTSWDKVNSALMKQGVQTKHIASIAQKTSHENVEESRGHKVLATFFKNREVAQRAFTGQNDKEKQPTYNEKDIETPKKEVKKESVNPALMAILKKRQEAQKKKEEDKKKVSEAYTPSVQAPAPKKTKSTSKEYASVSIPGTKRVSGSKSDNNEPGEQIKEDQYTSEYKIKYYVDPVTGENKTRKIRPHRVTFKASKMHGEPAQQDAPGDYGMKEGYVAEGGFDNYHEIAKELIKRHGKNVDTGHINDIAGERDTHRGLDHSEVMHHVNKILNKDVKEGDEYDEKWKEYKGKSFKKEQRMLNFNDYLKEAHLSAKQKKIAAIAGDKDKIDADDLAALRAGKKDFEFQGKTYPVKVQKEEVEQIDEAKTKQHIYNVNVKYPGSNGLDTYQQHRVTVNRGDDEHGRVKAAVAKHYGEKKHDVVRITKAQFSHKNPDYNKGISEAKEEVEQIDELSKKTLGSYVKKASADITKREVRIDRAMDASGSNYNEPSMQKALNKNVKRVAGLNKAADKLAKEEVEQIDEAKYGIDVHRNKLSKLLTHASNAGIKAKVVSHNPNWEKQNAGGEHVVHLHGKDEHVRKFIQKHHDNDPQATDDYKEYGKSVKEEVEQIDEISKNIIRSVAMKRLQQVKKSAHDTGKILPRTQKRLKGIEMASKRLHKYPGEKSFAQHAHDVVKHEKDTHNTFFDPSTKHDVQAARTAATVHSSKARSSYHGAERALDVDKNVERKKEHQAAKKAGKNVIGHRYMLGKKIAKEEVEQIDELSKKTLGSYVNKAAKDSRIHGQIATDFENTADKARKQSKRDSFERLNRKYLEKAWKREDGIAKAVGKLTKEEVELDESAGDKLLQAAREYKQGSHEYHKGMIKYHDHMADVHHGKPEGKEHEERMSHHKSELAALKEEVEQVDEMKCGAPGTKCMSGSPRQQFHSMDRLRRPTTNNVERHHAVTTTGHVVDKNTGKVVGHIDQKKVNGSPGSIGIGAKHNILLHGRIPSSSPYTMQTKTNEEVELDEGRMKDLDYDLKNMGHDEFHKQYGKPKSHFDPTNFKKPVQPGKEMDRARALAQRGIQSLSKEEVERIEEKLAQLDELSKKTLGSYVKKASGDLASSIHYERDAEEDDDSDAAGAFADRAGKRLDGLNRAGKKIAKEEVELEEATTRKDFQMVADLIKGHESAEKRKELATHHAGIFKKQNPRFDHAKFMKAAGVNEETDSEYLKATLAFMDESKYDDYKDALRTKKATQSAFDKDFKPDTTHPHIQVVKGTQYGGENQKDDEGDEKPEADKEKRGRGRPSGSKSGARLKGGGHEDGGIPVHNLHLPKSYK